MTYRPFSSVLLLCALLVVCGESAAQNTASSDADLSGLTLSAGTLDPAFARDSLAYTTTVANNTTSLTVTPTSNHNGATITVNGTSVSSGSASSAISLGVGENTIAIVVAAEDGTTTKTYTVTVERGVNIPDANLRAAIEGALKKSSGAIITPSEMATLTGLYFSSRGISDLTGLEHAISLTALDLAGNRISDISSLQGLTSLTVLHLSDNRISDISALSGLTSLTSLSFSQNSVSDISALQGLNSLISLRLIYTNVSDISPLKGLSSLRDLSLSNTNVSDISPLKGLSLFSLGLSYTNVSDISSLQGLTSLRELSLSNTGVSDISSLSGLTSLTELYLSGNFLTYPSLATHIPAFRSRGVYVSYDARTLTSLVKISGDDQTGTASSRLSDPFIVEVRDQNDVAFAGVPVAFSVTAGGGSLSTTTDATDADGRASTRLTLGAAGANTVKAIIDVSDIDKSVTFTATATGGTTVEGATISSTVPDALTEANLDGAKVNITLTGTTYNETLDADHFALHTAPQGASISGTPVRTSATVAQLTLTYTGLGFDANQSLRVTVKAAAHSGSGDLTTGSVTVTPAQVTGPVTVVTEVGQVTGVTVTPGEGYLDVSWNAVNGATGYKVQWKSGDAVYASDRQQVIDTGSKTSATIAGLTAGTEYTVRVIATLTNADDGPPSVGVTGTPIARTQPPSPPPTPPSPTSSDDADLSGLTLSAGTLDPAFARDSLAYTATVANSTTSLTVTPTSNHNGATITVNGTSVSSGSASSAISLGVGENTIAIVVTAEDNTTTKTYTVTVERGVNIPDANLRAAIEGALEKSSGAIITPSEMATMTRLYLIQKGISDLTGLEHATSLTALDLAGNRISDISSLQRLTSLTVLHLSDNRISDISALSGLTSLTSLSFSQNSVSDISALQGLNSLISLRLIYTNVSDISPLKGLSSLRELSLSNTNVSDISPLQGLSLFSLGLSYTGVSDISSLQGLTSLRELSLSNTNVSDISSLSGLTSLTELYLSGNFLTYPSLATHIPAFESRSVYVSYDARTLTSLVKISGDDQTGTAGSRLSDPFIVEVRDQNDVAFAGVPVAFSVTAGGGSLSTTTDATDSDGRASTRLTLGAVGANTVKAIIDVTDIDKSVTFTATATGGTTVEEAAISSTVPDALTAANLDGAKVNITLTGTTYNETLDADHFALHTAPQGASISGTPVRISATVAQLTLAYTGLGFDANQSLRVTVKAAAHSGTGDLTTESVTVTPAQVTGPGTVVTELAQVTGVEVMAGVRYLDVSWNAVNGATGYKVQWKSGEAVYASDRQRVIGNGGTTSATIPGLTAGTEYTVRVIATLTNADDGPPSVGVMGTPADFVGLTLTAGTTISITLPQVTGGDGMLTYSLTPDLPSGLTFDATTRVIAGTPREVMDETEYTLATDGDGATLTFTISVIADRLPAFGTSTRVAAQRYIIGDSIRVTLPEATGGDGTLVYILLPFLPSGLRFDSATRTISGMPSRVLTETEYTLSALDADGDSASLTFTLEVQRPTADIDGDGQVDFADFLSFVGKFGTRRGDAEYDARYDLDSDGEIGFSDFLIFASNFGTGG